MISTSVLITIVAIALLMAGAAWWYQSERDETPSNATNTQSGGLSEAAREQNPDQFTQEGTLTGTIESGFSLTYTTAEGADESATLFIDDFRAQCTTADGTQPCADAITNGIFVDGDTVTVEGTRESGSNFVTVASIRK